MAADPSVNFVFEYQIPADIESSAARTGKLHIVGRSDIETPNFLAIGSRGVVPHITPDVLKKETDIWGVHLALEDCKSGSFSLVIMCSYIQVIEKADKRPPPILKAKTVSNNISPLHAFTALPLQTATLLAPRRTPAVTPPSDNGNTNTSISTFTSTGFQSLANTSYLSIIENLRPDIAIALADTPYGTTPGSKRIPKMVDRTHSFLEEMVTAQKSAIYKTAVLAPILPISAGDQFEYLDAISDELVEDISGVAFYSSDLLPDLPATTALATKIRLSLDEPSSPHEILRQVSLGMDIFAIPFTNSATDSGIALSFTFPPPPVDSGLLSLGIDMWSTEHAASVVPLVASCNCYACTTHHRAFVTHLLSAKEMLGWGLLQIHNHAILTSFFDSIRTSIRRGTFEEDAKTFVRAYEVEMPEKTGKGPRLRGYHGRSLAPGESKKNTPAWGAFGEGGAREKGL